MTFGSVCSGIEAASVAWHGMGWRAAWLAEIEPFPSAVLAHHYPDVPNLGDMTTIADKVWSGDVVAPDVLVGGTPCQAFSVAGLRQSLDDDRGQLSLEFVRLANAIDSARLDAGKQPAIIVWENVPGVLNTKDNAFGCFLAGLAGESSPLQPAGGKWTNAGCVFGLQRAIAWRVLDAQFFGVPQRRRRVFVVASARDAFDPSQILFEFDGVRRDIAPSRKTGQEIASNAGGGFAESSFAQFRKVVSDCATLKSSAGVSGGGSETLVVVAFPTELSAHTVSTENVSPCLIVSNTVSVAYSFDSLASNSMKSANPHSGCREVDLSKTLDSSYPCPSKNQGGIGIVQATYGIPGNWIGRKPENGGNAVEPMHDVAPCLTGADRHGVAVCFQQNASGELRESNTCYTLNTNSNASGRNTPLMRNGFAVRRLMPVECERLQGFPDGYTCIPYRKKTADLCPDSPRYKALGNSMAVPCMAWIGGRIAAYVEGDL